MNTPSIEVRDTDLGKGVFALQEFKPGDIVIEIKGTEVEAANISDLHPDVADHALQIGEHRWLHADAPSKYLNHSCAPNCGIRGVNTIVAMTRIRIGDEITFDYEMSERDNWRMDCRCGSPLCRGTIGSYDNLPPEIRKKYRGYISEWIEPAQEVAGRD